MSDPVADGRRELLGAAQNLIETARAMNERGINNGTSGNVSVRVENAFLITPSGVPYDRLTVAQVIRMQFDNSWSPLVEVEDRDPQDQREHSGSDGDHLRPSSEWRFHRDIFAARAEVGAVVHAHPTSATALAVHGRGIEAFHYMVAVAGGHDIRCAEYATFGTAELSERALAALQDRKACLLAHHGMIAVGADLDSALAVAVEVEVLAEQYLAALAVGEPPLLTEAQMDDVLAKFGAPDGYGSSPEV